MKTEYRFYPEENLVVLQLVGRQDFDSLVDVYMQMLSDEGYRDGICGLVDMRRVASQLSMDDLRKLSLFVLENTGPQGLWVALVAEPLETAMVMMYRDGVSRHHPVAVVSSVGGASKLLKMDVTAYLEAGK